MNKGLRNEIKNRKWVHRLKKIGYRPETIRPPQTFGHTKVTVRRVAVRCVLFVNINARLSTKAVQKKT